MSIANDDIQMSQGDVWKELAAQSQNGDKRAYNQLLSELVPYIRMQISGSLANPDWVDDIIQEILISVHKSLGSYSADRPFKPWVNAIIQFRKTDFLRKHYKNKNVKEASQQNADTFANNVTQNEYAGELKDIEQAMEKLPEKQQKIFRLMKIEGYSAAEVAKEMDMTVSAVKVSAHRTAGKLKDMLG